MRPENDLTLGPGWLSSREVSRILLVSPSRAVAFAKEGKLRARKHGAFWVFWRPSVEAFEQRFLRSLTPAQLAKRARHLA